MSGRRVTATTVSRFSTNVFVFVPCLWGCLQRRRKQANLNRVLRSQRMAKIVFQDKRNLAMSVARNFRSMLYSLPIIPF